MLIKIYLVSDRKKKDRRCARAVRDELRRRFEDRPEVSVHTLEGFEDLATFNPGSDLFQILGILPSREFRMSERQALESFRRMHGYSPFLPASIDPARDRPPPPLERIRSFPLHDLESKTTDRLETWLEIQFGLRLASSQQSIFVSYCSADGTHVAKHLEEELGRRGFEIFRDNKLDEDGQPLLGFGTEVQQQIHREISRRSLLLVVDTPGALGSQWVREEVRSAIKSLRPVLPVVVPNLPTGLQVAEGGRFRALQDLRTEKRIPSPEILDNPESVPRILDDDFFIDLEKKIQTLLSGHLQVHKTLVPAARRQFERLEYDWREEREERFLYKAKKTYRGPNRYGPRAPFRLLVQCSPYAAVLGRSVEHLESLFREAHADGGVLVFMDQAYQPDPYYLARYSERVFALAPDEIAEKRCGQY